MTSSKDDFEPFDWWVERLYRICLRHSTTSSVIFLIISTVFLTALVADDFGAVIRAAYDIKARPLQAIVLWTATAAIFILFLGRWALPLYLRHRSLYLRLARLYERQLSPILRPLSRDKVGWGMCLTLQPSPDLPEGWPMTEIEFERDPAQFVFPQGLQGQYEQYRREHFGNQEDRVRLMMTEVPSAYSDAPTLKLKIRHTLWSQVRF